ncbi:MAG: LysM peptidoglycan-binding domain-containing protein [Hyphomicrobiales bacterium]|nr:LysM peptidoglycan-binding domain-containing protein [Hyphomicrobiales bacterium]
MTQASGLGLLIAAAAATAIGVAVAAYNGAFDGMKPSIQGLLSLPSSDHAANPPQKDAAKEAAKPGEMVPPPLSEMVTRDTPPVGEAPVAPPPGTATVEPPVPPQEVAALSSPEVPRASSAATAAAGGSEVPAAAIVNPDVPTFDIVRVEPSGDAVIAGRAAPGAPVKLMASGEVVGEAVASATGEWVIVLEKPLPKGASDLSIISMASDGASSMTSEQRVAVAVPQSANDEVLVVLQKPGEASTILAVPKAKDEVVASAEAETAPVPAAATDAAPAVQAPVVGIRAVEAEGGRLFVSGISNPGAKVRVYVDNGFLGEAETDNTGNWRFGVRAITGPGDHRVRVDSVAGAEAAVVARAEVPFVQEADAIVVGEPDVLASGEAQVAALGEASGSTRVARFEINRGDNLWRIARRLYGEGVRYTTIFEANRNQIRDPDLIYPGQVFLIPKSDGQAVAD